MKQAQLTINMNSFLPGSVPNVREGAVISAEGVLPIGTQLQTAFGTDKEYFPNLILDGSEYITSVCDLLIIDGRIYTCRENEGIRYITDIPIWDSSLDGVVISGTYIEGYYYICLDKIAVYKIDTVLNTITEVTASTGMQPRRISSFGLRLLVADDEAVSWSSMTNQLDFVANPSTGAGTQAIRVLGAYGLLVALAPASNGFIVYTEAGLIVAAATEDIAIPFRFNSSIISGYVLESPYNCVYDGSAVTYAVFRGHGLCTITIANTLTTSATVAQVNPFIGMSGEVRDISRIFPFMGGYLCIETSSSYYFRDAGQGTFSSLTRKGIRQLISNTSLCVYNSGRIVSLSPRDGIQRTAHDTRFITIGSVIEPLVLCGLEFSQADRVYDATVDLTDPDLASISKTYNFNLMDANPELTINLNTVPTTPNWGESYQYFWLNHLFFTPCKADTHTEDLIELTIPLQYNGKGDAGTHWQIADAFCHIGDSCITVEFNPYAFDQTVRSSQVIVGGISYSRAEETAQRSLANRVLFEELPGLSYDDVEDYNIGVSLEDLNDGEDIEDYNVSGSNITAMQVDGVDFSQQTEGVFTGRSDSMTHTVLIEGQFRLGSLGVTLLPRGFR